MFSSLEKKIFIKHEPVVLSEDAVSPFQIVKLKYFVRENGLQY